MEEAVHLLRSAPLEDFTWYLLGTLPFLLGLLYFWTDMSWSAVAFQHRAEASLGVTLLFVWMKCGQAIFCGKLRARLSRREPATLRLRGFVRLALFQALTQPTKLFALPLAALATIPFGWVFAFYESATALGDGAGSRQFLARSWRQAGFWPQQNHGVLLIYFLLRIVVFLNVAIIVYALPFLLQTLTGIETVFTQSPLSFLNTTSLAASGALTYVICDPLLKAIYTLRCFHGAARHSGEDLVAEVRALPRLRPAASLTILLLLLAAPLPAAPPRPAPPAVTAAEMNHAIDETMKQPRFSWRLPRQIEAPAVERRWPFVDTIDRFLKATSRVVRRAFDGFGRWLEKHFFREPLLPQTQGAERWQHSSRYLLVTVLILLSGLTIALVRQTFRQLRLRPAAERPRPTFIAQADLSDENLSADRLPEEEWLTLARQYLDRGELRLALRAYFFAGLAHLGAREVIALARHKSNRDYRRELRRKARDQPPLLAAFEQNVATVEKVWYGRHEIDQPGLERFTSNLEQIQKC